MKRQHLTDARKAAGLTAIALAEQTGIKEDHIYAVERGRYRPRADQARIWAAALRMTPEVAFPELFGAGRTP